MNRSDWKKAQAAKMKGRGTKDDPRLQGRDLRYGGRTLDVRIFVNTDESAEELLERLQGPARGPKGVMVLFAIGEVTEPELVEKLWQASWTAAEETVRKEN